MIDSSSDVVDAARKSRTRVIGRKSWVSYLGVIVRFAILWACMAFIHSSYASWANVLPNPSATKGVFYLVWLVSVMLFSYRIAVTRSYRVSLRNDGIWLHYGVLPWAKGANGIRWRDADMSFHVPTFLSWITNSYTIGVNHKYTNAADFYVTNIWRGKRVSGLVGAAINDRLSAGM